ncbi:MAG: hypothetical protein R3224_07775 [Balneolaceae bacterium]|nr:hypothetical protein [Balneolaceae bacterium]
MLKHIFFVAILIGVGYYFWQTRPVTHGPGVIAPTGPDQRSAYGAQRIEFKNYDIKPLAEFNIEARVLAKKRYTDRMSDLSPYDISLGWGPMSDERILDKILVTQSDRYYNLQMANPPIPEHEMIKHSANIHLATSDEQVINKIRETRIGEVVSITGYLVEIYSENGWTIRSSLRRDDYGDDASEFLWIRDYEIK